MDYKIKEETLTGIADAIRSKTGKTEEILAADFADNINSIDTSKPTVLENIPIMLDFSNGNQSIATEEGMLVKSATIYKPETLIPENIAEGIDIAGIVGTLAADSGVSIKTGTVVGTGAVQTIEHNLGVTPDIFIIVSQSTAIGGGCLNGYVGFSLAYGNVIGFSRYGSGYAMTSSGAWSGLQQTTPTDDTSTAIFNSANAQTIVIGTSSWFLKSGSTYAWFAIGDLT